MLGPDGAQRRLNELLSKIALYTDQSSDASSTGIKQGEFEKHLTGAIGTEPYSPSSDQIVGLSKTELMNEAEKAAKANGVDPALFKAIVDTESNWDPLARSPKGAIGLTQLMPATATEMGVINVEDPQENLYGGAKYLRKMLDTFDGNAKLAVAAYNAGPGAVKNAGGVPDNNETPHYVTEVLRKALQ